MHTTTEETWKMTIDAVWFTDYNGTRIELADLENEVQSLFTAWNLNEQQQFTNTHVTMSFIAGPNEMEFSHTALVDLLNWELPRGQQIKADPPALPTPMLPHSAKRSFHFSGEGTLVA